MSLYKQWEELASKERTQEEYDKFWENYLLKEKDAYEFILANKKDAIDGKYSEVANMVNMDILDFMGFLQGINTSLVKELELETLNEDSNISLQIDFEKLYYNMLQAKAEWLYTLEQWNDVLTEEVRETILKEYKASKTIIKEEKVGRNDLCPCGSGKKYKKCCGR